MIVKEVYRVGDEIELNLNYDGEKIRDTIKEIEPAVFIPDDGDISKILMNVSKVYFTKNPDLPFDLGSFQEFEERDLRIRNDNGSLVLILGAQK